MQMHTAFLVCDVSFPSLSYCTEAHSAEQKGLILSAFDLNFRSLV